MDDLFEKLENEERIKGYILKLLKMGGFQKCISYNVEMQGYAVTVS